MKLTDKETTTVLAALRALQEDWKNVPSLTRARFQFEEHEPLTLEEIDDLCVRINCGEPEPKDPPDLHRREVQVIGCSAEQADQVLRERLGHDEDYGFDYILNW